MYTNRRTVKVTLALVTICMAMLCGATNTIAQTNWSGASTGDWHTGGNWSGAVPNATTDARIIDKDSYTINLYGTNAVAKDLGFWGSKSVILNSDAGVKLNVDNLHLVDSNGKLHASQGNNNNSFAATFNVDVIVDGTIFQGRKSRGPHKFNRNLTVSGAFQPHAHDWVFGDGIGSDTFKFDSGLDVTFKDIKVGPRLDVFVKGDVITPTVTVGDIGTYHAQADGALGNAATTFELHNGGELIVTASQTNGGSVNVKTGAGGAVGGLTDGYALFDAPSINLAILNLNTPYVAGTSGAEITTGSEVIVSGTLGGAGAWGGGGTLTVTEAVAPGASIDTITGSNLAIATGGTYELEIADPDSIPGTGWDLIDVDDLTFDGAWNLDIIDFGLTRDIDPSEQFVIAMMDTTDFDPANASITTPLDWFVGPNPLFLDNDGNLVLTNVSNIAQTGAAVPEPASIAIWSILGICLAGYGYRRR